MRFNRMLLPVVIFLLIPLISPAQENTSWRSGILVDISAGVPFYIGDFDHPWDTDAEFTELPLGPRTQYNNVAFAGSISFPLSNRINFRLRYFQSSFYFSEESARVFFRNTIFDTSGLFELYIIDSRWQWYINGGVGLNSHFDADIYRSLRNMETEPNFDRKFTMSTSAGTGIQYSINPFISVFAEADWLFTGSDRIDGWNGDHDENPGAERESQKSYFKRDQLLSGRGGIRFNLFRPSRPVAERSQRDLVSSYVPDPDREEEVDPIEPPPLVAPAVDDRPEEYRRLDIRRSLEGITIAVDYATGFDELERQRDVALRIADQVSTPQKTLEVFLLEDNRGFTVHFGTFTTVSEAHQFVGILSIYYSGTQIRRH